MMVHSLKYVTAAFIIGVLMFGVSCQARTGEGGRQRRSNIIVVNMYCLFYILNACEMHVEESSSYNIFLKKLI